MVILTLAGFFFLGITVGALGTMIGVGGGFIVVPLLMFLYPERSQAQITAISMFMVGCNATSGATAYFKKGLVHWRAALAFGLASLPGAVLGVHIQSLVDRATFSAIFGCFLLVYALYTLFKTFKTRGESAGGTVHAEMPKSLQRKHWILGVGSSFIVGFLASFLGIGGGVIHVPLLHQLVGFTVHQSVGTSHAILASTAWLSSIEHFRLGNLSMGMNALGGMDIALPMGIGALIGAQIGSRVASRISAQAILRVLGILLALIAVRLILSAL